MLIRIPRENKEDLIRSLQHYFHTERSEEIGQLAAENLLDFFLKKMSPYVYNQGVEDAKKMLEQHWLSLEEDILSLERPILNKRND